MRNGAIVALLVVGILAGAAAGYFIGSPNLHTVTSTLTSVTTSVSTTTFVSSSVETVTSTVTVANSTVGEGPIPITSVETGNITIGGSPVTMAVNPNASRIYLAGGSNILTVVDAASHTVVARVTLPAASASGIAVDYETGTVYVLTEGGIAVVNGTTDAVVKELPVVYGFRSIAFDSSTDTLYGSPEFISFSYPVGSLVGIDARTGAITANISIGYWASDILVNPQLNLIYAIGCNIQGLVCNSMVSVLNGTSAKLVNETRLGSFYYPTATIDEKTGMVYVSGDAEVVALNPYGTVIYNYYPDTCGPFIGMADDSVSNQIIMAPQNYNYLLFYNEEFGNLVNMYSLPLVPQYVAFNPATNETYLIVSESLLAFHSATTTGHINETLIGADQFCLPP